MDHTVADRLKEKVRVFAAILTSPRTKLSKAVHVKATWAKRFNGYAFFSSEEDKELPSIREVSCRFETISLTILFFGLPSAFMI